MMSRHDCAGAACRARQLICAAALAAFAACGSEPTRPEPVVQLESLVTADLTGRAGDTVPQALIVVARSQAGRAVARAPVTWTVLAGGGTIESSGSTDSSGRAEATWILGPTVGEQVAVATSGSATVIFSAHAVPGAASVIEIMPRGPVAGLAGFSVQLTARAYDRFGNEVMSPVSWTSSDHSVAVVNEAGLVQSVAPGNATIRARLDEAEAELSLIVASWLKALADGDAECRSRSASACSPPSR